MRSVLIITAILCLVLSACQNDFPAARPRCTVAPERSKAGNMGIAHYLNLESAKECAAITDRKILLMFTGYASAAVPGQEWRILRTERVRKLIDEQFVLVVLYVDDKDSLIAPETIDLRNGAGPILVYTIGQKNSLLQVEKFNQNAQPLYATLDTNLNVIETMGYTKDSLAFEQMLRVAVKK